MPDGRVEEGELACEQSLRVLATHVLPAEDK